MAKKLPFKADEAHDSPGFLLWQVTTLWQRHIAAVLHPYALTQTQFALLASILWLSQRTTEIRQVTLARHAKLDVMMTSQVLRTLERRGFLTRTVHPDDPRAKSLALTKKGTALTLTVIPLVEDADQVFFADLAKQQTSFMRDLQHLITASVTRSSAGA